jgi:phenylacetic acid degradation operon negative regulatory protein
LRPFPRGIVILGGVNARSALFDVYGDHLRERGGAARVASLVRLLAPLGVAAPAVRTAVSRMVRQGWLTPAKVQGLPGYALTPRAARRLDDAAARIYRTRNDHAWDGTWHLLVVSAPNGRSARDRVRSGLSFLGYGPLDDTTWIAPRPAAEVDALLAVEGARAERFTARHDGDSSSLISRAWDLESLARAYVRFLDEAADVVVVDGTDRSAYIAKSLLLHEWRKFLFRDPGLPLALLPVDWPGSKAAEWFDAESARLQPGARRYVDACLDLREQDTPRDADA